MECDMCADDYHRLHRGDPAEDCTPCSVIDGVRCRADATTATLNLTYGYWRHSNATNETWRCKWSGSWSPCRGGIDPRDEGDGYCEEGYRGPRCEICSGPEYSRYFEKLAARCHDCGDVTMQSIIVFASLLVLFLAAVTSGATVIRRSGCPKTRAKLLRCINSGRKIWLKAGMRYKIKALVGLVQCISAIPSVFDVTTPSGLEEYAKLLDLIEFPADFGINVVIPASCFGSYRRSAAPMPITNGSCSHVLIPD